jgi:hypothetical protein
MKMKWITVRILIRESGGTKHLEMVGDARLSREAWRRFRVGIPRFASREGRHNIAACLPSRTTSPLLCLITSRIRTRGLATPARAPDARSAVGRPANRTAGPATAGMNGTRSTPAGCALSASTIGPRRSASSVAGGRRIRIGTSHEQGAKSRPVPYTQEPIPRTGQFGTVSELKLNHTLAEPR